ncbi:hypothetical protein COF68_05645 [Bacillus toyonensis]|uniref:hypothetical protein n=1 Tax=Bacillus toyonensis TaxID=155322 RepID=UPI000BFB212F|nr:hypothetical protein [Bacillus toyonensis]PHE64325.1 hypothetical protein COF68_05645 [Bacillus toyonensis]
MNLANVNLNQAISEIGMFQVRTAQDAQYYASYKMQQYQASNLVALITYLEQSKRNLEGQVQAYRYNNVNTYQVEQIKQTIDILFVDIDKLKRCRQLLGM